MLLPPTNVWMNARKYLNTESKNWHIQIEKEGRVLQFKGKPYFEKQGSFKDVMLAARDYMLKEKSKRDEINL